MDYKSLKCSPAIHQELKYVQGLTGYSITDVVDAAIREFLENHYSDEVKVYKAYRAIADKQAARDTANCRQGSIL